MLSDPRTLVAVWVSGNYLYVKDDIGQKYCVSTRDWKYPWLASIVRVKRRLRLDSKELWPDCRELVSVELVTDEPRSAA